MPELTMIHPVEIDRIFLHHPATSVDVIIPYSHNWTIESGFRHRE
jgi:hypothetical protein